MHFFALFGPLWKTPVVVGYMSKSIYAFQTDHKTKMSHGMSRDGVYIHTELEASASGRQREVVQLCLEEQLLRFLENFRDKAHQQLFENPLRLKLSLPVWIYFFLLLLLPLWALSIFHMHTSLKWWFEHTKWASQMKEFKW